MHTRPRSNFLLFHALSRKIWLNTRLVLPLENSLPATVWCTAVRLVSQCDLNCSVRARVSSSRMSFWTPPNLNSEVSTLVWTTLTLNSEASNPKILLFSYWFFLQIGWAGSIGLLRTLSWRCSTLRIKVCRCPETRTRAGNSSSY